MAKWGHGPRLFRKDIPGWTFHRPYRVRMDPVHGETHYSRRPGSYRLPTEPTLVGELIICAVREGV